MSNIEDKVQDCILKTLAEMKTMDGSQEVQPALLADIISKVVMTNYYGDEEDVIICRLTATAINNTLEEIKSGGSNNGTF